MSTQLADALNDKNNITKTIKAGAAVPIEYTDPVWEDETFPFTQAKQGSADVPSFNFTFRSGVSIRAGYFSSERLPTLTRCSSVT